MPATFAASLPLTLLLSGGLAIAIIAAVVVVYSNRHAPGLAARLRRLTTNPRTADDTAPADAPQQGDATGSPPPPTDMPANSPARTLTAQLTGARYAPDTFALVAEHADHTQRLAIAEARVERVLSTLPSEGWFVQRFALAAGDRIPFLVLGEYGIFALWPIG
ncbi:MAG: hypothetical protein ACR2H2_00765 [Solirubrobacteraceae bacterium]